MTFTEKTWMSKDLNLLSRGFYIFCSGLYLCRFFLKLNSCHESKPGCLWEAWFLIVRESDRILIFHACTIDFCSYDVERGGENGKILSEAGKGNLW